MPLASKNLSQIVTLSRASARMNTSSAGTLTTLASGIFGIDYDPSTLSVLGMPVEEQRTNTLTYSEQLDNVAWTKARSTVTANASTAPNGATAADKIVEDATAANTHYVQSNIPTAVAATVYTFSCFVKAAERTEAAVLITGMGAGDHGAIFNLSTGAFIATINTPDSYSSVNCGNGWWRLIVSKTASTSVGYAGRIHTSSAGLISYNGDGTSGIYAWGAQLEAGSFASSYMGETTTAAVTRLADSLTIGTLSPWMNNVEGTIYCEVASAAITGAVAFAYFFDDATANNSIYSDASGGNRRGVVFSGGVAQAAIALGAITPLVAAKTAFAYKANDFAGSLGGGAAVTDASGSVPTVTRVALGNNFASSASINGWLRKFIFYPSRKTNAELVTMSA